MRVAIIGSRNLTVKNLEEFLPSDCDEIISGGARGIDTCARVYAEKSGMRFTEILPDYKRFGKGAPLVRNKEIVALADMVIAFWDGKSNGTRFVIEHCKKMEKPCKIILL